MEEEPEELYETAQVLLDKETGNFTHEVSELLDYVGSDLLVMDRVGSDARSGDILTCPTSWVPVLVAN